MLLTRDSVLLWPTLFAFALFAFGLAFAAIPAGATVRTAPYSWVPASGPVAGYYLYLSVDGRPEENYGAVVGQNNTVIELDSGARVVVRVVAFDGAGRIGPPSDASSPLRLCPGDFDGDEVIEFTDVNQARSCLLQPAVGQCAAADMDDDGAVLFRDISAMEVGSDACPPIECAGDMNGDGLVTLVDWGAMKTCIGLTAQGSCANADFDGNGFVSVIDVITAYKTNFGQCQ
jgi:hypothetical protein